MATLRPVVPLARRASLAAALCVTLCSCGTTAADPQRAASRLDSLLSEAYPAGEPGAAVLVSRGGTVILKKGYGLASIQPEVPVTPDTVFRLASVTKMFTATAVLMLAEKNQLALDDPVTKILPACPAAWQPITVRHLLSHTAGLADYLDRPDSVAWARHEYTVQDLIDAFKDRPAAFAPGRKNIYSNSNYVLLGAIIEKISGVSFGHFVETNLFAPLGMASTSCEGGFDAVRELAGAYEPAHTSDDQLDWSRLTVARPYTMSALYAAGGCVSSAGDLARFNAGLFRGGLVGKRTLSESFEPARLTGGSPATMSAGGWQLDTVQGRRAVMRGGALPGVCTWVLIMPDDDVLVILLSNRTPGRPRCGMLAVQIAGIGVSS
jgi:D-alanyl-D-alanine carboxypeptidase